MKYKNDPYLKKLQENYLSDFKSPWGLDLDYNRFKELRDIETDTKFIGEVFKKLTQKEKKELKNNYGFYFNLVCPQVIEELNEIIKVQSPNLFDKISPKQIVWGSLPSYELNASSFKHEKKYYITINESLLYLLYETYRLIFYLIHDLSNKQTKDGLQLKLDTNKFHLIKPKFILYFNELYSSFLNTGITTSRRKNITPNKTLNHAAAHVFNVSLFFVFCHEYSHIALDHFQKKTNNTYDQQLELESDLTSSVFSLIFNSQRKFHPSFGLLSIEFFFAFSKFLQSIIKKNKGSHPIIDTRRKQVAIGFSTILSDDQLDITGTQEIGDDVLSLLHFLWSKVENNLISDFESKLDQKTSFKPKESYLEKKINSILSLFKKKEKKANPIAELFEKFRPFTDYVLSENNGHFDYISRLTNNKFSRKELSTVISGYCFRIQYNRDNNIEDISNRTRISLQRKNNIHLTSQESIAIGEYIRSIRSNFIIESLN